MHYRRSHIFRGKLTERVYFLLFIVLCFSHLSAQTEKIKFRHLNIEEGLSENSVYCILQDREGFLWFGTQEGLNKYDGYSFTVYKHDPSEPYSISSNSITCLFEDKNGNIWIGTQDGGLNLFEKQRERFSCFKSEQRKPSSLSSNDVETILEDRLGNLWIGTNGGGLNLFDRKKNTFKVYRNNPADPSSISSDKILSIFEDFRGRLWIGTEGGGINVLDRSNGKFSSFTSNPGKMIFDSKSLLRNIYEDSEHTLWLCGWGNGLYSFDPEKKVFRLYAPHNEDGLPHRTVSDVVEESKGKLWVGSYGGGIDILDKKSGRFEHHHTDVTNSSSLNNNNINKILKDRQGNIWVATYGGGVNFFHKDFVRFHSYRKDPNTSNTLSTNVIMNLFEDHDGKIWIGTWGGGLNSFDPVTGRFTVYNPSKNQGALNSEIVNCIAEDKEGKLWMATGDGLNVLDRQRKYFHAYQPDAFIKNSLPESDIYYVFVDHEDQVWCGMPRTGLCRFDRKTSSFTVYKNEPGNPASLSHNAVIFISEDSHHRLWVGTWGGGLNCFDRGKGTFKAYKNIPGDNSTLLNNTVNSIYEAPDGKLWVATGGGISILDTISGKFTNYTEKQGLLNNMVYGILPDDKGYLWISTNKGISRLKIRNGIPECRNYNSKDGMPGNEFNGMAYCKTRNGGMYFGSNEGFTAFHPDSITDNPFLPQVYITDFQIFNRSIPISKKGPLKISVAFTDTIILTYKQNVFSFEFAALNFTNPEKNNYAYIMEGFDKSWNYTDAGKRFATYTNLDPGTYKFRVKASNNDGLWNNKGASLVLIITPPFWQTWWFRLLLAVALITIVSGSVYYASTARLKKKLAILERKQEIETVRSRISSDIHDDLGAGLSKMALISELGKLNSRETEANFRFGQLSVMAGQLIDSLHGIIWAISPQYDNLKSLLSYIRSYTFEYFENTGISVNIDLPSDIPDLPLEPGFRRNLLLFIKEAYSNIVRHSGATEMYIAFRLEEEYFDLSISDNGQGVHQVERGGRGNGFHNMEKRTTEIGCLMKVNTGSGKGTVLIVEGKLLKTDKVN